MSIYRDGSASRDDEAKDPDACEDCGASMHAPLCGVCRFARLDATIAQLTKERDEAVTRLANLHKVAEDSYAYASPIDTEYMVRDLVNARDENEAEADKQNDRAERAEAEVERLRAAIADACKVLNKHAEYEHGEECPARFCEWNDCECPFDEEADETTHAEAKCDCYVGETERVIERETIEAVVAMLRADAEEYRAGAAKFPEAATFERAASDADHTADRLEADAWRAYLPKKEG